MTDDELTAIEARANAATAGPWTKHNRNRYADDICDDRGYMIASTSLVIPPGEKGDVPVDQWPGEANTEFIAHARTDVPALVAEVRDLRWVLKVIGEQQDGAWGNIARQALDGTMKIGATRERWEKAAPVDARTDVPAMVAVEMVRDGYLSGWNDRAECAQQDVGVPSFAGVMNRAQAAADKITMK